MGAKILLRGRNITPTGMLNGILVFWPCICVFMIKQLICVKYPTYAHVGRSQECVHSGKKGKITFFALCVIFGWSACPCMMVYIPMYGQRIWILDKDAFHEDFETWLYCIVVYMLVCLKYMPMCIIISRKIKECINIFLSLFTLFL